MTAPKGVAKDRADPAHFATRSLLSMCLARPPAEAATDRGSSSGIWDRTDWSGLQPQEAPSSSKKKQLWLRHNYAEDPMSLEV